MHTKHTKYCLWAYCLQAFHLAPFSSLIGLFYSSNKCCNTLNSTQCNAAYIISCFYSISFIEMLPFLIIYKMAVTFNRWNIRIWKPGNTSSWLQAEEAGPVIGRTRKGKLISAGSCVLQWETTCLGHGMAFCIQYSWGCWSLIELIWGLRWEAVMPAFFRIWLSRDL